MLLRGHNDSLPMWPLTHLVRYRSILVSLRWSPSLMGPIPSLELSRDGLYVPHILDDYTHEIRNEMKASRQ